jgi:hypothetical protein
VSDGHERVPSFIVFDHVGLRRTERHSGAARRVVRAMRHLGWQRTRFQVKSGSFQRVRGFQRDVEECQAKDGCARMNLPLSCPEKL